MPARPIYKKLLFIAIAIYVIGSCVIVCDIYNKIGDMEHSLMHSRCEHAH